ncbi:LacI family DNA-binding transcriptional regulator [Streptomyces sp. ME19-01-6]|uniref:LacI family DNA-binding transcriptional regulator n=1 Tax=Streptomyces sp. ME19-01-6 TaxID=3028686 RepID=UPI0029A9462A|nr:LacI family DNA-binding transcriptional regulator [Streptomyces sp. ME19-01-6]MDX3231781.1 LacI family DNA-binding transcriptional regulator [Streptomyces sp. ME19-01-6]
MAKRVTINDVATAAGVSRQTVTRAHNDMGDISEATKRRVLEVSAQLGYRPNRFARNLVGRQRLRAVGLLVGSFSNPYFTEMAGAFLAAAAKRGWQVMMASGESGSETAAVEMLARHVDLFVGHFSLSAEELTEAVQGIPVVLLDDRCSRPGFHSVEIDLRAGIRQAMAALEAKGVRRMGMIDSSYSLRASPTYSPSPRRRFFEEFALEVPEPAIVVGEESMAGGGHAFRALMAEYPDVDGVLVFNDMMAIGAVQAAQALGVEIPGQVRILGVDGLTLGEAVRPTVSTISLDREALVASALDIADALAASNFTNTESLHRTVMPRLLWRESA